MSATTKLPPHRVGAAGEHYTGCDGARSRFAQRFFPLGGWTPSLVREGERDAQNGGDG